MTGRWREPFGQGSFLESMNDPPKTTQLTQKVNSDGADDVTNNPRRVLAELQSCIQHIVLR